MKTLPAKSGFSRSMIFPSGWTPPADAPITMMSCAMTLLFQHPPLVSSRRAHIWPSGLLIILSAPCRYKATDIMSIMGRVSEFRFGSTGVPAAPCLCIIECYDEVTGRDACATDRRLKLGHYHIMRHYKARSTSPHKAYWKHLRCVPGTALGFGAEAERQI